LLFGSSVSRGKSQEPEHLRERFPHQIENELDERMRIFVFPAVMLWACCTSAIGQTTLPKGADHPGSACPPGAESGPTVGRDSGQPLSDRLAQSKGVICPPAGIDPQMHQPPPEGGAMKVVPPPGSPGGNPNVQPK